MVEVICVDDRGKTLAATLEAHGYSVRLTAAARSPLAGGPPLLARIVVPATTLEAAMRDSQDLDPTENTVVPTAVVVPTQDPAAGGWPPDVVRLADGDTAALLHFVAEARSAAVEPPWHIDAMAAAILDALDDGVALVDARGHVQWTNRALLVLFQLDAAQLHGQPLSTVLPDLGDPVAAGGGSPWLATEGIRGDGSRLPIDVRISAVEPDCALVTARDAAPRRLAELTQQTNNHLREQVQRSQRIGALGRLAGGLAHDFNNLLQVIGGYAESLSADTLDAAGQRRLLGRIKGATDRAASLTRQLLAFGRSQALVPQVLDLNTTVQSLEHLLQRVIGEDVQMSSELTADLPPVKADPGQIEQVLLNLALNARDAMQHGGTLTIATAGITTGAAFARHPLPPDVPAGDWVLVTVRDTGSGMDAETAAQAFEPFFTTKDPNRGSGLGLSMVHGIVKQSGGHTWIESTPGVGTAVHVLLPAFDHAAVAGSAPAPLQAAPAPPQPGAVLLVEDDAEVRALFATFLRQVGHTVVEAADGREALDAFDAHGGAFDIVVSDVVMPHLSGPSLVRALRARRETLKVLFLSGYSDQLGSGPPEPATAHLPKPVSRAALVSRVADLLGRPAPPPDPAGYHV
jgi:two-component system cell cycle sensor histidine kinase/response regulator CckA